MTSNSASSLVESTLWTNFVFIIITAILLVSLLYQYLLPWHLAANFIKKNGRDPRPRVFYRLVLFTILSLLFSSVLNVVFLAQDTPSASTTNTEENSGPALRIHSLSLNGWIALMVLATIAQQLPYVLLFLTLVNILQSRWYAFISATTGYKTVSNTKSKSEDADKGKLPAFLGWRGKESTSFFLAFLLVLLPLISRIILAVGMGTFPNPMVAPSGAADFEGFENLSKVAEGLDGLRAGVALISVLDIGISSFFLEKRLRAAEGRDSITTSVLRIFSPLMAALVVQMVVASGIRTLGPTPTEFTLAVAGLATTILGNAIATILLVGFSLLYAALPRWLLVVEVNANVLELPTLPKYSA